MYLFNILHDETIKLRDLFMLECLCFLLNPFGKLKVYYSGLINMVIMISRIQFTTNQPLPQINNNHIIIYVLLMQKRKKKLKNSNKMVRVITFSVIFCTKDKLKNFFFFQMLFLTDST